MSEASSNLDVANRDTLMSGHTIDGTIGVTYGKRLTARLGALYPCYWRGWVEMGDRPSPDRDDIAVSLLAKRFAPALGVSDWCGDTWRT